MRLKFENTLLFVMILILIFLSARIYNTGQGFECVQCNVEFSNKLAITDNYFKVGELPAYEMYEYLKKGECLVTWEKVQGYSLKNQKILE